MSSSDFKLSVNFTGHEQDVRGLCVLPMPSSNNNNNGSNFLIGSSSRDRTVRIWNPLTGEELKTLVGHEHFVGTVLSIPSPNETLPFRALASGGNDKIINIWDVEKGNPVYTLLGHTDTVCALSLTADGLLISGSWDKTARIWRETACITTLSGHEHSVWAVLGLPNGDILTGSADHTIKVWSNGNCVKTLKKHTDCVRALTPVPGIGFLSCGNDGAIYLWGNGGEVLQEMHGHGSFVYSVGLLPSGEFISGGEDRALKIWKNGECVQTLMHPGSVWCVSALPNGDIVTGCSDGIARVWTRDSSRVAGAEALASLEAAVSKQTIPKDNVGELSTQNLPGPEVLQVPGTKEGQTKLVKNGSTVEAYQWSSSDSRWIKIGEVTDAKSGGGAKQVMSGKEYDYIFDVDIGDGQMRKIGYNNDENPYVVAQDFLWREELDQSFLDTVAQFLIKNADPVVIGSAPPSTGYADPFTGGNRYVPGKAEEVPKAAAKQSVSEVSDMDIDVISKYKHFPARSPILFDTGNFNAIHNKALQFNGQLAHTPETSSFSLNESEQTLLSKLMTTLGSTSRYHATNFSSAEYELLVVKLLPNWPEPQLFPILDILRLFLIHPDGAQKVVNDKKNKVIENVLSRGVKSSVAANQMLALRFVANLFRFESNRKSFVLTYSQSILDSVADLVSTDNKNVKTALLSVLYNFSAFYITERNLEGKMQILSTMVELLANETENETIYLALVTIGNLTHQDDECKKLVGDLELDNVIKQNTNSSLPKVKECALELVDNLK